MTSPSIAGAPSTGSRFITSASRGLVSLRGFLSRGFRPYPVGRLESILVRALFAYFVIRSTSIIIPFWLTQVGDATAPNGIAHWFDLSFIKEEGVMMQLRQWAFYAFFVYIAGLALPLVLPFLTFCVIVPNTVINSQGFISHANQIVGLVLLVQTVVVYAHLVRRLARWIRCRKVADRDERAEDAALCRAHLHYFSICAVVTVYVTAAVTKYEKSDGDWIKNSPYFSTHIVKIQRQNYYKRLDPQYGDDSLVWAHRIAENPNLSRVLFGAGFFLELFAFFALYGRRSALIVGLALIGLHVGIEIMMALNFKHNSEMLLVFLVNPGYWLIVFPLEKFRGRRGGREASS